MFTVQRQGYTELSPMVLDVIDDMRANGFTVVYPAAYTRPASATPAFRVILETSTASNALHADQPWRICLEVMDTIPASAGLPAVDYSSILVCHVGTSIQLGDDGFVATYALPRVDPSSKSRANDEPVGNVGAAWTSYVSVAADGDTPATTKAYPASTDPLQSFFNRFVVGTLAQGRAYPMSYRLSITNRGLFIGISQSDTSSSADSNRWLLVQRSVNKDTGVTLGTTALTNKSKCPVYCINGGTGIVQTRVSVPNGNGGTITTVATALTSKYYKFIVREKDILAPSKRVDITTDSEDNPSCLNPQKQVSFNEDGNYVISLFNNLTTPRFRYTDELDMVGTISADVIGEGQELDFVVYGEAQPRTYVSLNANGANNTGMRLMVLVANPNEE